MSNRIHAFIAGYNCEKWVSKCFDSIKQQTYKNYICTIVNDSSTDKTQEVIDKETKSWNKVSCHKTSKNQKWLKNSAQFLKPKDNDIVVTIDMDDWLPHQNVFERINQVYEQEKCWLTYGSYSLSTKPQERTGQCRPYAAEDLRVRNFRRRFFCCSHLRTFRGFLWNNLDPNSMFLDWDGNYADMAYDCAIMFPMLEMCKPGKIKFLKEILYVYNMSNPISDGKRSRALQKQTEQWFRKMPMVKVLDRKD